MPSRVIKSDGQVRVLMAHIRDVDLLPLFEAQCKAHHVTLFAVLSGKITQAITRARYAIASDLREQTTFSYQDIGEIMGLDHSTVIAGIRVHRKREAAKVRVAS